MKRSALIVVAVAAAVLAQDADGLRLRLEAVFSAKDAEGKKKALDALEGTPVPKDLKARVEALRRALPPPARKGASRITEKVGARECFFVTPKGYDAKKSYPAVFSFHGRNGDGHEGIRA